MTKPVLPLPPVSKRTRSKIKQTTLLDYKVPEKQRQTAIAVKTRDVVSSDDSSGTAAVTGASNANDETSHPPSSSSRPNTDHTTSCHETTKRGTRTKSTISVNDQPIDRNRRARNGRHFQVANAAASAAASAAEAAAAAAAAAAATTAAATTATTTTVAIASATNNMEATTTAKRQATDVPPSQDESSANHVENKRTKKNKGVKVCYDIISATKYVTTTTMVNRVTRHQQQQQQQQQQTQNIMESVTPSPESIVKQNTNVISNTSSKGNNNNAVQKAKCIDDSKDGTNNDVDCSTPPKGTDTRKEENLTDDAAGESKVAPPPLLLLQPSVVTVDRLETLHQSRRWQPIDDELQSTKSSLLPTFHHPWQQPYQPALSNNGVTFLPPGVDDIDVIPHSCCLHSHQSHAGYSWISSRRRCGCAIDSNHNSSESMTEAYLGSYGVFRYGSVGLAGNNAGKTVNESDWKTERWWLQQTRKGIEANNKVSDRTSLSNNTETSVTKPGSVSLPRSTSSRVRTQILPFSVERHIDYMQRQPYITVDMRRTLMDWLLEVTEEYKLSSETFWLSVTLVDRSLACSYGGTRGSNASKCIIGRDMLVPIENIQLVGCACTLIASKLIEIIPPTADDFVYITDKTYTRNEVLEMEAKVCNALKFNFNYATPYRFVYRFLRASYVSTHCSTSESLIPDVHMNDANMRYHNAMQYGMNSETNVLLKMLVFYLLDLAVLEYKLVLKKPSLVAAAAVYLARATLGIREFTSSCLTSSTPLFEISNSFRFNSPTTKSYWSKTLEYYTGYEKKDLEDSVRLLHSLQRNAENCDLVGIFNKHKGNKCRRVAMKTALNEDELGFR